MHPGPDLHGFVASMLAPSLHCATRTVRRRVEAARRLVCTAESTFQALWDADLDQARADAVADAARSVAPDLWPRFEALVLETTVDPVTGEVALVSDAVKRLSRAELARRAARVARTLDQASHDRAAGLARDQRTVVVRPNRHLPGLASWTAHLPTGVSQQMAAAVDALAGQYARAHPGTGIDGHRADALADLVLGNAQVTTVVELLVPVLPAHPGDPAPTAATRGPLGQLRPVTATTVSPPAGDAPGAGAVAWLVPGVVDDPRHGVLVPQAVAALLSNSATVLRLARLDPDGSITQDPTAYRPSAATRRRVRARDGSCRFPGCATPAARTDTDHVVPHPHGPTAHANLISLCRTHHLFKHHGGWTPALAPDGTVTWTAPDHRTWTTHPRPHQLRAELTLLERTDPDTGHHLRRGWYPGLPPGMSLADLTRAEHHLPDDPPETDHPRTTARLADPRPAAARPGDTRLRAGALLRHPHPGRLTNDVVGGRDLGPGRRTGRVGRANRLAGRARAMFKREGRTGRADWLGLAGARSEAECGWSAARPVLPERGPSRVCPGLPVARRCTVSHSGRPRAERGRACYRRSSSSRLRSSSSSLGSIRHIRWVAMPAAASSRAPAHRARSRQNKVR